jgi:acetyl-CoA carboxylase carboxyltransferase component
MAFTMEVAATTAYEERMPFVAVINSAGADIADGIAALHGWGRVAAVLTKCSGVVPTFAILDGPAVSGPALLLGLMDFVVVTDDGYAFVNGPLMVRQFTGIEITKDELGSPASLERHTGLPVAVVPDRDAGVAYVEELLAYLPTTAMSNHRTGRSPIRSTGRVRRRAS